MSELKAGVGLISGGLDSAVVAGYMRRNFEQSHFVFCEYGQKTQSRERQAFDALVDFYQPESAEVIPLPWMRTIGKKGQSALFEEGTRLDITNRKLEYVPFRNATMLSAAVGLAEIVEANAVLIGSTGGDVTCPDNSPAFLKAYEQVIREGTMTDKPISILAPLIERDKKGVIELGLSLDVPFELTWSCHNNSADVACGDCSNCSARHEAFTMLGHRDPIRYERSE